MSRGVTQLKELVQLRFSGLDREAELRDKHTELLQRLMESKLSEMNQLRNENREMQKDLLSRNEYQSAHQRLMEQVAALWKFIYIGVGAGIIIQLVVGAMIVYFLSRH